MKNNIAVQIESGYGDLRKSEKQAADYILNHMEEAAELPLARLAKAAKVSQPTVLRMLKAAGYEGYRDFRYQLVAELAKTGGAERGRGSGLMYGYTLDRKEGLDAVPLNITMTTERMMEETLKNLPLTIYRKVIDALRSARLIDIYSVENSEVAAMDLMTKLFYLGLPCRHFSDAYLQQITAAGLTEADVAVGISYSGESRDTVDALKAAKQAGACTIAVTNSMEVDGKWRFTSPTHVVLAFAQAMKELEKEGGIEARSRRYTENNRLLIEKMGEMGIRPYIDSTHQGPIITTFFYPEKCHFTFSQMYEYIKDRGYAIYPGKVTEAETFRIGNIGEIYKEDIEKVCAIMKEFLEEYNHEEN